MSLQFILGVFLGLLLWYSLFACIRYVHSKKNPTCTWFGHSFKEYDPDNDREKLLGTLIKLEIVKAGFNHLIHSDIMIAVRQLRRAMGMNTKRFFFCKNCEHKKSKTSWN